MTTVVILAMVSAFLAFRLYSVLGKRTGHEQQPLPRAADDRLAAAPPLTAKGESAPDKADPDPLVGFKALTGVRAIAAADSQFEPGRFVEGAKMAYRMVLEAYWKGDEETLETLVDDDVRAAFVQAIGDRKAAGHVLENRLVAIEKASISDASLDGQTARVTVKFDADIAAITRDGEGTVIAGSMSDAVPTHDVWTFSRNVRSADPNWILVDTDEAA